MNETIYFALGLGFLLGLKHAVEADHIVAVTTIVSEQRSVWRSALVGALWGGGHTVSLFVAGVFVILLGLAIPEGVATLLEMMIALMIILLGSRILYLILRDRRRIHLHTHEHDGQLHTHLHFHDEQDAHSIADSKDANRRAHHTGAVNRAQGGSARSARSFGWKPFVVGLAHGLAGSAALTLLVLTEVVRGGSRSLGLAYLVIFGVGSIGGMLLMSALISLPFVFTAARFERFNLPLRLLAGAGSVAFGFYYLWEKSIEL